MERSLREERGRPDAFITKNPREEESLQRVLATSCEAHSQTNRCLTKSVTDLIQKCERILTRIPRLKLIYPRKKKRGCAGQGDLALGRLLVPKRMTMRLDMILTWLDLLDWTTYKLQWLIRRKVLCALKQSGRDSIPMPKCFLAEWRSNICLRDRLQDCLLLKSLRLSCKMVF